MLAIRYKVVPVKRDATSKLTKISGSRSPRKALAEACATFAITSSEVPRREMFYFMNLVLSIANDIKFYSMLMMLTVNKIAFVKN